MKKLTALVLALALVLSIAACSNGTASADSQSASEESDTTTVQSYKFKLGTPLSYETEYKAEDGTVLLTEKYELPLLMLEDENGNEVDLSTDGTLAGDICDVFNGKMQDKNDEIAAYVEKLLAEATESYASRTADSYEWMPYSYEYTISDSYMTDDGMLSIVCLDYEDLGGAHPSSYTEDWNFDLLSAEFITLATLTGDDNPLGEVLRDSLSASVQDDIREQNLSEGYFDTYLETVNDLANTASCHFTENGMTITFDTYVLAPYAAGPQAFDIPYGEFYYALSARMQLLLPLSQEDTVCADYQTAQVFWSWFNMAMPPIDVEDGLDLESDNPLYRVKLGNFNTLDDLRLLLCTRVSEELADTWLATGKFVERDGALYTSMGERGGDITIGKFEYSVAIDGDGGVLTQTVYRQEYDAAAGDYAFTGETEEISYPFELDAGGHAVFTAFPCPL